MNNLGLVIGYVYGPNGTVSGATVYINEVRGSDGKEIGIIGGEDHERRIPLTDTDASGFYILPFLWSGADIAEAMGNNRTIWLGLGAFANTRNGGSLGGSLFTAMGYHAGKIAIDVDDLGVNRFQSLPDLLDLSRDFIKSFRKKRSTFRKMKKYRSKVNPTTSEGHIILSAANLVLNW